jgi:RNA polymerase sigma-70 factor, ECF subfamily
MDEEQLLITSARNGDLSAFNTLILQYQSLLFGVACRILSDEDAAADAVQNALISAFRHFASFHNGSLRSWLTRITINMCYDELRRNFRRPTRSFNVTLDDGQELDLLDSLPDSSPSTENLVQAAELERVVQSALRTLSPLFRTVVVLVDVEGYTYEQAADILRTPVGTVKSRLARARIQLRLALGNLDELQATPLWFNVGAGSYRSSDLEEYAIPV